MQSFVWSILYICWVISEVGLLVVTRTRPGTSGQVKDRGSLLLLWPVIACSISLGTWYGETHGHTIAGGMWTRLLSIGLLGVGLLIRWSAILRLGRSFSANVAIHATQRLERSGIFRFVRHPSYSGLLLIFAAVGLHSRNWFSFAIILLPTALALSYRIHVEEAALREAFGSEYADYCRTTKRLIPGIY